MENYKEIIEKLKDDERFIEVVQETLNARTSKEILKDAQQWKQLLKETQGLRQNYENLIADESNERRSHKGNMGKQT